MELLKEFEKGSIGGVPFFIKTIGTSGGRKKVVHEFLLTSRREVEDLGGLQETIIVEGFITTVDAASGIHDVKAYNLQKNKIINVLNKEGAITLVSPSFGKLRVYALPYKLNEVFTGTIGEANFSMEFKREEKSISRLPTAITISEIYSYSLTAKTVISSIFFTRYFPPEGLPDAFVKTESFLTDIYKAFNKVARIFNQVRSEISSYKSIIETLKNNIRRLVNAPGEIISAIEDTFDSLVALAETPEYAIKTLSQLFGFGDDTEEPSPVTIDRQATIANTRALRRIVQQSALVNAFQQASLVDYLTVDQITNTEILLYNQFNKVYSEEDDLETLNSLLTLHNATMTFLAQRKVSAKNVITITTPQTTLRELVYRYYGNLDNYDTILGLNQFNDVGFISGSVKILSE